MKCVRFLIAFLLCLVSAIGSYAVERVVLVGPKTIGPAWKDRIVLESRLFAEAEVGDVLTVYTDGYKRSSQGSFQSPKDWQAIAEQYKYFGIAGPFRMTVTADMLPILRQYGLCIG